MKKILLFASGSGTNVENIMAYFKNKAVNTAFLVLVNNPEAKVIEKARKNAVPVVIFDRNMLNDGAVEKIMRDFNPDLIVLAGFLWKLPETLVDLFENKIINIHPALLPKYGGKGMYGKHVHQAVLDNKEQETGITIHFVNANYDEGNVIFQATTPLEYPTTVEAIAEAVQQLEYCHFPEVIENLLKPF
ncbi:phosphoribosylglycinamide formyltransferase [Flavobacterium sp. JP2137]|uniref:phosphoribosylglycinamide formyltransferase n=1 Tax=Flavobacterium sp. JP2137 TaxID=3414510 RepID=UPI003D300EF4